MCFPLEGWQGGLGCCRPVKIPKDCSYLLNFGLVGKLSHQRSWKLDTISHLSMSQQWKEMPTFNKHWQEYEDRIKNWSNFVSWSGAQSTYFEFCKLLRVWSCTAGAKENVLIPWVPAGLHRLVGGEFFKTSKLEFDTQVRTSKILLFG